MDVQFTREQQEVIDLRGCNVLVSAAAGSGKTAVLTERIVKMVSDEEHPVDIDRLLVVTFTSAAAAEMRERIGRALNDRLMIRPESEHLQRQTTLLHNAQITTIDSFCLFLVKNHFHEIGLDPAFRVADEREIKLLRQDTLSELLEDAFTEGKQSFLDCVEALCPKGREKVLEDHVLNLSRYAASFPWPKEWLLSRKADYGEETLEHFEKTELWNYLKHYFTGMIRGCEEKLDRAIRLTREPDGPYMYGELLEGEKEQLERLLKDQSFDELSAGLESVVFGRLPSKKDDSVNPAKRERAKALRDEVKKILSDLKEQFFFLPYGVTARQGGHCREIAGALVDLVLEFDRRMREKKQEKKLIDFTDMEHFALDILLTREGDQVIPSRVARQYREYYHEIFIDEYQDSNLVQEFLLRAISGEEYGNYNRFMVGDVKQSIYRFRLARPELFLQKYDSYKKEGPERRIDLSKNFRSRDTVIGTVNQIFERVMSADVGGISYDEDAALNAGASYPPLEGQESELLVIERPDKNADLTPKQAEALAIADRIRRLMREGKVTDFSTGETREVRYRDVVILLRSLSGWGEEFKEVLEGQGIPAYVTSKSGYFTATEVQGLLGYLRVIDNPLQDIPLFGVMRSQFGGFDEEEIALLRGNDKKSLLYDCLKKSEDPKVRQFLERLASYRQMARFLPIRALLEKITWDYDYLNYVTALPGGSKRRANVEMLFVKASDFEKTSYFGLFHFLRYMDQLEKYEEDYGAADILDENSDVVRIMSIHKSKGLEFPVVFVSGLAKNFNMQDVNQSVILDVDLGIGMDYVDFVRRVRNKTLRKNAVAKKLREDTLAEELRLFYVALTRAKEKLILTAASDEAVEAYGPEADGEGDAERLSYLDFMKAGSYLDFLSPIRKWLDLKVQVISAEELAKKPVEEQLDLGRQALALKTAFERADREELRKLQERLAFRYPHANLEGLYTKTTVSELKIAAMSEKDEAAFHAFEERETESYVPEFRRGTREVTGTVRGNAYHRVMELLEFREVLGSQFQTVPLEYEEYAHSLDVRKLDADVVTMMEKQKEEQRLTEEYFAAVRPEKIREFLASELGYRMWRAYENGRLYREQPFVLSLPATRLRPDYPAQERVLIQGIIDVYFMEGEQIVLLDYKTDSVKDVGALWNRYAVQLEYYQEALERLTGKPVKEKILYSFHLGKY